MLNIRKFILPSLASVLMLCSTEDGRAQQPARSTAGANAAADQLADIFSKVGDQLFEECIFELSQEQIEVQAALVQAYLQQGATDAVARRLAATQIQPPKLSVKCEQLRKSPQANEPRATPLEPWTTTTQSSQPKLEPSAPPRGTPEPTPPHAQDALSNQKGLPQWDCADGVDYVTVHIKGHERKLTGGEICNPYEDVVHEVPPSLPSFRLGYTIASGRLFIISDSPQANGKTITWGLSGRDVCRNNPSPDCFAAKAVGPLPPGEYAFAAEKAQRVSFGPRTKRYVAGVYLKKLWNKDRFSRAQIAAIMARGNIAIHMRLKGEMSEACIGLEAQGWAYVASLIRDARATGLNVYIDEPHPEIAEAPPIVAGSSFSLTSLFK